MKTLTRSVANLSVVINFLYVGILSLLLVAIIIALSGGTTVQDIGIALRGGRVDVISASNAQLIRQDASQRAILLINRGQGDIATITACSEPPPDIAQNLAQTLNSQISAFGKNTPGLDAAIAADISRDLKTATESLFQRSQGIQLLRDTMFRLCEGFQNKVLTSAHYRDLILRLMETANFIIPFEQCTSVVRNLAQSQNSEVITKVVDACLNAAIKFNDRLIRQTTPE